MSDYKKKFLRIFILTSLLMAALSVYFYSESSPAVVECIASKNLRGNISARLDQPFKVKNCQSVNFEEEKLKLNNIQFGQRPGGFGFMPPGPFIEYEVVYKHQEFSNLGQTPYSLEVIESDYTTYANLILKEARSVCEEKNNSDLCWYRYATQTSLDINDCLKIPISSTGTNWQENCIRKLAEDYFPELCDQVESDSGWCEYNKAVASGEPANCYDIASLIPMQTCYQYFFINQNKDCSILEDQKEITTCNRQKERFTEVRRFLEQVKNSGDVNECSKVMGFNFYKDCYRHFAKTQGPGICEKISSEVYKSLCKHTLSSNSN